MFEQPEAGDRDVIQGLVAHGYARMKRVCHFIVQVENPFAAREFIGDLVRKGRITTAKEWSEDQIKDKKNWPAECVNIGFAFNGLKALGLKKECENLERNPELEAFVQGAVRRADRIGDEGVSHPEKWGRLRESESAHVLLSLYARKEPNQLESRIAALKDAFEASHAFREVERYVGETLGETGDLIHFGFKDGISQPRVRGFPMPRFHKDGNQTESPAGSFVLGYPSQREGLTYDYEFPPQLGKNGSFAAFRVLEQDVVGFYKFLKSEANRLKLKPEDVAAMLCGRRLDGTPLISPNSTAEINDFSYSLDREGQSCPFGAHIRRTNPRDDDIAGNDGSMHRIIRRGMPYGPPYDPDKTYDGVSRGLLGLFICANLRDQFEFIMRNWVIRGGFQGNLKAADADPLISRFVRTRGGMYCFLPSIDGLKYIAAQR